jgi:hypothetical protein
MANTRTQVLAELTNADHANFYAAWSGMKGADSFMSLLTPSEITAYSLRAIAYEASLTTPANAVLKLLLKEATKEAFLDIQGKLVNPGGA